MNSVKRWWLRRKVFEIMHAGNSVGLFPPYRRSHFDDDPNRFDHQIGNFIFKGRKKPYCSWEYSFAFIGKSGTSYDMTVENGPWWDELQLAYNQLKRDIETFKKEERIKRRNDMLRGLSDNEDT